MSNVKTLRSMTEACIRAGEPYIRHLHPTVVIAALDELEAERDALRKAARAAVDEWENGIGTKHIQALAALNSGEGE